MANYHLNSDYFGCVTIASRGFGRIGQPRSAVEGVEYVVLEDLVQEPVTLSEFKEHARIDFNVDDNLASMYLKSARQYLEQYSQLSFGDKKIQFTALRVPNRWRLMFGPFLPEDSTANDHVELFGAKKDILLNGGENVDIELYTGWGTTGLPDAIKVAICRYAAGLYAIRENLIYSENGVPHEPTEVMDEAQKMLAPFMNVTWP